VRITLNSVLVHDQDEALAFYTDVLGFVKKTDLPLGESRWITVMPAVGPDGMALVLEPTAFPPALIYQKARFAAGIPLTAFASDDLWREVSHLKAKGVVFHTEPTETSGQTVAIFDDTCGNLIQLYQG
jgi:catechol 2,3-dioxygenase-like lactoylglutathione lyase family enzyme